MTISELFWFNNELVCSEMLNIIMLQDLDWRSIISEYICFWLWKTALILFYSVGILYFKLIRSSNQIIKFWMNRTIFFIFSFYSVAESIMDVKILFWGFFQIICGFCEFSYLINITGVSSRTFSRRFRLIIERHIAHVQEITLYW